MVASAYSGKPWEKGGRGGNNPVVTPYSRTLPASPVRDVPGLRYVFYGMAIVTGVKYLMNAARCC